MSGSLGIFVSSEKHLEKIINICKAANPKEIQVSIFFTHLGTMLTKDKRFKELEGLAEMGLCKVSFKSNGLEPPAPGIGPGGFSTQSYHSEILEKCDRYLVF